MKSMLYRPLQITLLLTLCCSWVGRSTAQTRQVNYIIQGTIDGVSSGKVYLKPFDPAGRPVSLSDFRGNYVLLDFWASWCVPCRKENPTIVEAYETLHPKGFTVLGVSLDDKKEAWLQAIKDDGLSWTHVSDLQFWENVVARQYAVSFVPTNYLLDPEGKIIAKNLRGEDLMQKLQELLQ